MSNVVSGWSSKYGSLKLSRDNEQIFALNYENLCDHDYLNRLFTADGVTEHEQSHLDAWAMVADLAEDILMFGKNGELSKDIMLHRMLNDDTLALKYYDSPSETISRQIFVFGRIGSLVVEKCKNSSALKQKVAVTTTANSPWNEPLSFLGVALTSALGIIEKSIGRDVSLGTLNSLITLLPHFFQFSASASVVPSARLSPVHMHRLRCVLCRGVQQALSRVSGTTGPLDMVEAFRIALQCAYGILIVGLNTGSVGDTLLGMSQLLAVSLCAEEKQIELDESLCSPDAEVSVQEKLRMRLKLQEKKLTATSKKHSNPQSSLPEGDDEDIPPRELGTYEVKVHSLKAMTVPSSQPPRSGGPSVLKPQGSDKKMSLQLVKGTNPVSRPGLGGYYDGDVVDAVATCGTHNGYPVSTWRVPSDHTQKKNNPASSIKGSSLQNMSIPQSVEDSSSHTRHRARSSLENLQRVPKDILDSVAVACSGKGSLSNDAMSTTAFASTTTPTDAEVWTCGQNSYGELGHGDVNLRRSFTRVSYFDSKHIGCIGAGNEHSLFVSQQGKTYVCGYNDNGQCGMGTNQQVRQPSLIPFLEGEDVIGVFVFNGCEHTLVLTRDGKLFSFGYNYRGQLGLGTTSSEPIPRPIKGIMSRKVTLAACSYHHTVVVCADRFVFSFGRNDCGQLGHGDVADKKHPHLISTLSDVTVASVSCGQFHTVVVTAEGGVLVCGKNDYGQLGLDGAENVKTFSPLTSSVHIMDNMLQVCCGYYHTVLLSRNGQVYGFGRNDYGQLGLGHAQPRMYGVHINSYLRDKSVTSLAAGCYHSIAVTSNGMLYVFGRNNHGQLGTGDIDERHTPHPVDDFVGKKIVQVAAGFYHTIILVSSSTPDNTNGCVEIVVGNSSDRTPQCAPQSSLDSSGEVDRPGTNGVRREVSDQQSHKISQSPYRHLLLQDLQSGTQLVGVRELFMFLSTHLDDTLATSKTDYHTGRGDILMESAHFRSITLQLRTAAMVLQINRQCVNGSLCIDMPFSQEETFSIIGTVLRVADLLLGCNGISAGLKRSIDEYGSDICANESVNYSDLLLHQNPTAFCLQSAKDVIDRIASIHTLNRDRNSTVGSDDRKSAVRALCDALLELRLELLFVYFFLQEGSCDHSSRIVHMTSACLSKHFEVLFWSTESRCKFISFLADCVTDATMSGSDYFDTPANTLGGDGINDSLDYLRSLRLFTQVCFKYRSIDEVISLFQTSNYKGLLVYRYVLDVYTTVSRYQLELRLRDCRDQSYESLRALTTLEHCCTHFTKCSIPVVLESAEHLSEPESKDIFDLGSIIISRLYSSAESVIDTIGTQAVPDDVRDALRNGTVLCSIFPTFMLFALSKVDLCDSVFHLSKYAHHFMVKLQDFVVTFEADRCSSTQNSLSCKRLKDEDMLAMTAVSPNVNKTNEVASSGKKEPANVSFWNRLLKLTVVLCAKLSSSSLGEPALSCSAMGENSDQTSIDQHEIWQYCARHTAQPWDAHCTGDTRVVSDEVIQIVESIRSSESAINSTYKTVLMASKAISAGNIIGDIENAITESVLHLGKCFYGPWFVSARVVLSNVWKQVALLIVTIVRKRTEMMSKSSGLSWSDVMFIVLKVVLSTNKMLSGCADRSGLYPLPVPCHSHSKGRCAFRRAALVILCMNRWKRCRTFRWRRQPSAVVSLYATILEETIFGHSSISMDSVSLRWQVVLDRLNTSIALFSRQTSGISSMGGLLGKIIKHPTIQIDVLSILSASWKEKLQSTSAEKCLATRRSVPGMNVVCSSLDSCRQRVVAVNSLVLAVQDLIAQFCTAFCQGSGPALGVQDITLFCLNVKFLRLVLLDSKGVVPSGGIFTTFLLLKKVVLAMDSKLVDMQITDDRNSGGAPKRASYRERASHLRRASSVVMSFIQTVTTISASSAEYDAYVSSIVDVHCELLSHFQKSSQIVVAAESTGLSFPGENGKDSFSKGGKDSSAHRRRCQELIVNPMQFNRNQEGFVVQGEKLLSNFKGIDFTLAFWVYVSKKSGSRYSFLMGKVSHNDAWPLIGVRGSDMKIEVLFGRANEFERLTGQTSIPSGTWVHIAVVIEPRKVRLFVNGVMDCQMTTAGNARAILYPVIIGSCPAAVRTRVEYVKEGFDGLVSSLKYYTRALSPIHVRVIFDQGPPEAHDARERLSYVALASCKSLGSLLTRSPPVESCKRLVSTLHGLLLSDSNRLRCGALSMMGDLLALDVVDDMVLSKNSKYCRTSRDAADSFTRCSILSIDCLPEYPSFHERFMLYVIRLIGLCWSPSVLHGCRASQSFALSEQSDEDTNCQRDKLTQFLAFCPIFVSNSGNNSGIEFAGDSPTSGGVVEVPVAREDLLGELCQNLVTLLMQLSRVSRWNTAISTVLYRCLSKCKVCVDSRSEWTDLVVADVLGAVVFLGGVPVRPVVGADVHCLYSSKDAKVISIDKATNHATILTKKFVDSKCQLMTVKCSDLVGCDEGNSALILPTFVSHAMLDLMESLGDYVHVLLSDLLAMYRPDHMFMRQHLIRACRPIEIFIYHQLLRRLTVDSEVSMKDIRTRSSLFTTMLSNSIRAFENVSMEGKSQLCPSGIDKHVQSLWMKCSPYIARMADKIAEHDFPPVDCETSFADFVTRNLGIWMGSFQSDHGTLVRYGYVSELVCSIACEEISSEHAISIGSLSDRICNDSFTDMTLEEDQVLSLTLRLLFQLRASIVYRSRQLFRFLKIDDVTFGSLKLPWKVMLWQQMALECDVVRQFDLDALTEQLTSQLLLAHGSDVTHCLISSIRYSAVTLLQHHGVKSSKGASSSIIESTDVTTRILQSMYMWVRAHQDTPDEVLLCLQIIRMLLPSLSCIESVVVELHVMTLCTLAVHRVIIRLLKGFVPSNEFVEFVNGPNFSQLWSRAQEHVVQERGHAPYNISPIAQKLVYLASGFAVIQRNLHRSRGSQSIIDAKQTISVHSMTPRTPRVRPVVPSIPPQPKIVGCKSFSVEIDVTEGVSQAKKDDEDCGLFVEIALRVLCDGSASSDDNSVYDTIYYGSCGRIVHNGLCASSMYSIRYRTIVDSISGLWSMSTEFRTESSVSPFVFDPLKCGSDIIVSQDGRTASYTGDDNWSTVLGNYPFTNGINSWEIKIASSSTAYIFVGVATSTADLNTFLGGCSEGWGFIGEQALYHGREKVKIYGEPFSAGDVVGIILDFISGTLSFTRNGKPLGIAFDKIYGELYPAVAFYNVGQEVEIVTDSARTLCPPVPLPCSPSILNLDNISLVHEMLYCLATKNSFSPRVLELISEHLTLWTSGTVVRKKALSGSQVFLSTKSPLLLQFDLRVGDRVRSQYGIAEIVGAAYGRVWFQTREKSNVWYFSKQQLLAGRAKGLFQRCSYEASSEVDDATENGNRQLIFDVFTLQELLDPQRWSGEIDAALVQFLLKTCSKSSVATMSGPSPWDVSCQEVCDDFRTIQQQLSRVVIGSVELSHKWGVTGPKRKAVLARVGMLRFFNHLLEHTLPILLPSLSSASPEASPSPRRFADEHAPPSISLGSSMAIPSGAQANAIATDTWFANSQRQEGVVVWPVYQLSWSVTRSENMSGQNSSSLASSCRNYIFPDLKNKHFWKILNASVAKVSKTDDDYDYPEDLPLVKLNRFKSFRAIEVSQLKSIPGDDLFYSTLFCQLWKELRQHSDEKLRISYTHPMDDGQSRTFKVRFEGEGVDDYGGPYREVFQKVCEELQIPDPSVVRKTKEIEESATALLSGEKTPAACFLPLLLPTANWAAGQDCAERYKYTFHPASTSPALLDLFLFLGQVVGIALRSRITLDLPLSSVIWKSVVREPLTDSDIASFDVAACSYVQYLGSICQRLHAAMDSNEALDSIRDEASSVLQDVTWTVTYSDGRVVELIPNGKEQNVDMNDLSEYLRLYVQSRLAESMLAIEAFRNGILTVIPESALSLLNWDELELLVCGSKVIDIERLKVNTEYDDDVSPTDSHIVAFWEVLSEFSEEEKAAFLRFVWARPTLPPKDVEFPQKLKIQSAVGDDASSSPDSYLPKAHTCFFSINLPRYSSKMVRVYIFYAFIFSSWTPFLGNGRKAALCSCPLYRNGCRFQGYRTRCCWLVSNEHFSWLVELHRHRVSWMDRLYV